MARSCFFTNCASAQVLHQLYLYCRRNFCAKICFIGCALVCMWVNSPEKCLERIRMPQNILRIFSYKSLSLSLSLSLACSLSLSPIRRPFGHFSECVFLHFLTWAERTFFQSFVFPMLHKAWTNEKAWNVASKVFSPLVDVGLKASSTK